MEQLHSGAKWIFRTRAYFILLILSFFVSWFIVPILAIILFSFLLTDNNLSLGTIILSASVYILLLILISELYARMSYNRWFYDFSKEGLKLERGIIWKRYSNVPYERIQNVDVHRGILARIFGFSTVMIQTAGFSGYTNAEGNIPAVNIKKAEHIRTLIMDKITKRRK